MRADSTDTPGARPPATARQRILFVCLGNICRSPLAEGILRHIAEQSDEGPPLDVDSAGTGSWHLGEPPDLRSVEVAARHGIGLAGRARQVRAEDFHEFDLVLAMDRENYADLRRLCGDTQVRASLALLREYDPEADGDLDVPDPYYGGADGFERVFVLLHRSCEVLLDRLRNDPA